MADTILNLFLANVARLGNKTCIHYKKEGHWHTLTWNDALWRVRKLSQRLAARGLSPKDKVLLWAPTSLEWTLWDLAILSCGAVTVPIYPTLALSQVAFIVKNSQARFAVIDDPNRWTDLKSQLENPGEIGCLSFSEESSMVMPGLQTKYVTHPDEWEWIRPEDVATIIYTSGTTGLPKGAMISHRNIVAEVEGLKEAFPFGADEVGLMVLPLAHVMARAFQFFALAQGCQIAYAENIEKLAINFMEVRPHFFLGVPRIFEKIHRAILNRVETSSPVRRKIFKWACELGRKLSEHQQKGFSISPVLRWKRGLAEALVFRKIKKRLGGRLSLVISGGAPLDKEIAQFFRALGILILEGYGLTETFAAITLNRLDHYRFGTVGTAVRGAKLKLSSDGEICVKGDMVFEAYWQLPEANHVFDSEGWFLTGDIGEFTKDGFLKITDRKKDLIITSGGKNVAPQPIENRLKSIPMVGQAVVLGDRRRYLTALLTLDLESLRKFARDQGVVYNRVEDLTQNEKVYERIQKEIEKMNQTLSKFETIKRFSILSGDFSIESGELTPTLKVKRRLVEEKYRDIVDRMYEER